MYEFFGWRELGEDLNRFQLACITDTISELPVLFPSVRFGGCLTSCRTLSAASHLLLYICTKFHNLIYPFYWTNIACLIITGMH